MTDRSRITDLANETILQSARAVLRKTSVFDLSIQSVVDQSGLSRATVYRHYSTPSDLIAGLAVLTVDDIKEEMKSGLDAGPAAAYARAAVKVLTSDSEVNRQVVLHASVQSKDGKWVPQGNLPESLLVKWGVDIDDAQVGLTYFRGAMYSWACGFFTDEQFAQEAERALSMAGDGR
ncbi:MAG TPA: TetR/AcrR family transcriptional regulator [Acidimicrobiia bacterium]|jgi:AcrR family transcriptional regulator|nr:TetR/AcrR family transcriptional regulator [Acidimicrobiia bacterium]HIL04577.1 TetR/AcrR family transcriptional regulator [Acidimicrobiia bacterium]